MTEKQQTDEIYHLDTRKALSEHLFSQREVGFQHAPFEREIAFYESVRSGNLETVKTLFTPLGGEGFGTLSQNPLRNLKYHLVVSIALITRFCISGGMQPEEAYNMSDVFIQKTDHCRTETAVHDVHYAMVVAFTKRMRQLRSGKQYSRTVLKILDYISDHLHERIYIEDIANAVSRSVPYISRLFAREMGKSLSSYIADKKVETAANMLQFSDYSCLEISNYLCYSSQSYFIRMFKNHIGLTPMEYKRRYFSVKWMNEKIDE